MHSFLTPFLFFILLLTPILTLAQQQKPSIYIPPSKSGYTYLGCYNETTDLPDTAGLRALNGGKNVVKPGEMTVNMCLEFCSTGAGDSKGGNTAMFEYVGLEYSRECWCARSLSGLSEKFPDDACNLPCDGNATQICGGNLKLTVYKAGTMKSLASLSAAGLAAVMTMISILF